MKKFEYRLLDINSGFFSAIDYQELTERLNVLGAQGWEVVAVVETEFTRNQARGLLVTLKREIA
ncbi:DUF4177 domain-containing protein [Hymenobacter sp. PAMC 26628]|uniref:DUF4177 domain-containing protein n=1 Tax=Hymenobacter sp. PAMC 26628 TaxID=1484118 RepID=UPI00077066F7|nr:DUF4177 domain-containing protein [Hymenobacter sp. PAMC 26628]AMJ65415.1 hypothetical protein AXW84_08240 [Hymenobacter sp. PAMC 26628]